jgi:dUTP pyrophosphatase
MNVNIQKFNVQKLDSLAIIPAYAHDSDAGADLYSIERVIIPIGCRRKIRTGIAIEILDGHEGQVRPRSGMADKWGVTVLNAPGTIDSGYRDEIKVLLINHGDADYLVQPGDRIAQLVIAPVVRAEFNEKAVIKIDSERGVGGFGSSGR